MSLRQYSHQWLLCRGDLASHKQQLQEARIKNDEQSHAIMQNEAQMVQLQKEKADVVSSGKQFQQDMVQAAAERQKAAASFAAGQTALSAAQVRHMALHHAMFCCVLMY